MSKNNVTASDLNVASSARHPPLLKCLDVSGERLTSSFIKRIVAMNIIMLEIIAMKEF
jgi:hypothetical protein